MKTNMIICFLVLMLAVFAESALGGWNTGYTVCQVSSGPMSRSSAFGCGAGYGNSGSDNTFVGYMDGHPSSLQPNITGNQNTFIGSMAGNRNTSGRDNTFLGYRAGNNNTTANYNTFLGKEAGSVNTTGYHNTFVGHQAGRSNTTGYNNTLLGDNAGMKNTTAYHNTFIGQVSGHSNTIGHTNTFLGTGAGFANTVGFENTFLGAHAGNSNTEGYENVFIGRRAGYQNATGRWNVYIGDRAGGESTGSSNVFIGILAGFRERGSHKLYIANSDTYLPLIYGEFDNKKLVINGNVGIGKTITIADRTQYWIHPIHTANGAYVTTGGVWTNASSREVKENIVSLSAARAMTAVNQLEPVVFNYRVNKAEKHVGFIAEDVPDLIASNDRKGLSPMDVVAVLTKVVQEQQKLIQAQQDTVDSLTKRIETLEAGNREVK